MPFQWVTLKVAKPSDRLISRAAFCIHTSYHPVRFRDADCAAGLLANGLSVKASTCMIGWLMDQLYLYTRIKTTENRCVQARRTVNTQKIFRSHLRWFL